MEKATLEFLKKLKANNKKEWFNDNRKLYEAALADFSAFVDELIGKLVKTNPDLKGLQAKDCLFRIFRDVRFSKDKSPYKANFGAVMVKGGRKNMCGAGMYVHIEPGGKSMLAGGMHLPPSKELQAIRDAIARDSPAFKKIINAAQFKKQFGGLWGEKLKSAPRGFPRDHPDIELLKFKSYTVARFIPDPEVLAPGFLGAALTAHKTLGPFNQFLNRAVGS